MIDHITSQSRTDLKKVFSSDNSVLSELNKNRSIIIVKDLYDLLIKNVMGKRNRKVEREKE